MKIRNWLFALGGAVLACALIKPAAAAPITYDVTFGASGFAGFTAATPPASFVLGHFNVTLDATADASNASTATLDFIDPINFAYPLAFDYTAADDKLVIGGNESGAGAIAAGTDDFILTILHFTSGSPLFAVMLYGQASIPADVFLAEDGLVHVKQLAGPVTPTPIPAALPLFISAVGGLGLLGWRRRKAAA